MSRRNGAPAGPKDEMPPSKDISTSPAGPCRKTPLLTRNSARQASASPQHRSWPLFSVPRTAPCRFHYRAQRYALHSTSYKHEIDSTVNRLLRRHVRLLLAPLLRASRPLEPHQSVPSARLHPARSLLRLYGRQGSAMEEEGQLDGPGTRLFS
jgi:hypothetical protein